MLLPFLLCLPDGQKTTFGGAPPQTGIGLKVKRIIVFTELGASGNPFQKISGADPTDSADFLDQLTRYPGGWADVCLAHAFTSLVCTFCC